MSNHTLREASSDALSLPISHCIRSDSLEARTPLCLQDVLSTLCRGRSLSLLRHRADCRHRGRCRSASAFCQKQKNEEFSTPHTTTLFSARDHTSITKESGVLPSA